MEYQSGSGNTLVDIISGLLQIEKGEILIDDQNVTEKMQNLTNKIGYVPQDIFLLEDSVKSNIIFSDLDDETIKVDKAKLTYSLENSNLQDDVNSLQYNIDTLIGEQGVQLQAVKDKELELQGLYRSSEIIIFDEAIHLWILKLRI